MIQFTLKGDTFDFPFFSFENYLSHFAKYCGYKLGDINFVYVSRDELLKMNQKHLAHDHDTDVITFDYTEGNMVSADVYIGVSEVQCNARSCGETFFDEMSRVMIHGLLHCMGYEDKTESGKHNMRQKENDFISRFATFLGD